MCLNVSAAISCAIKDPCEAFDGCLKLYHGCGGKLVQCSLDASCKQDPRSVHAGMLNHRKARRRVRCSQAFLHQHQGLQGSGMLSPCEVSGVCKGTLPCHQPCAAAALALEGQRESRHC